MQSDPVGPRRRIEEDSKRVADNPLVPTFPLEFLVMGTPVSAQSASARSKQEWIERVRSSSAHLRPEGGWVSQDRISAILYYFPASTMRGDLDNIVKLVLDALKAHIYLDDRQVERLVVQKFEPGNVFAFSSPSGILAAAMAEEDSVLYVRLSDDPFEDLS